jgi:hypothetical protein
MNRQEFLEGKNFSIVLGGPFFQLLSRVHLTGNALELVKLRIIVTSMISWLPLLLFSLLNGQVWNDNLKLPFIQDIEVHVRFLITLPLLIAAELVVHQRMLSVVKQFEDRNLIPENGIEQFYRAISSALRLRDSVLAETLMIIIVYVIGYEIIWHQSSVVNTSAWYSEPAFNGGTLSMAGIWFRFVSLPFFQFLILRWYYRIFIWFQFLFRVSRIKLKLVPTHPDEVGGLGFLTNTINAFIPLALAHGAILAGMISNHIFFEGDKLLNFKIEIVIVVALVLCMVILPLFSFSPQLAEAKRIGTLEYGKFASQFVSAFQTKWVNKELPVDNSLIGADIQSLADLGNSYKIVENMNTLPITRNAVIILAVITIAPVLPLVLTMMPIGELIKMLASMLF